MDDDPWRERDRRLRWYWLTLGLGLVSFFVLVVLDGTGTLGIRRDNIGTVFEVWLICFAILFIIAAYRLTMWPCPRCKKAFALSAAFRRGIPWAAACGNCGLAPPKHPMWATPDEKH
jgi:hypothetical protein